jgi:hypothetical protein
LIGGELETMRSRPFVNFNPSTTKEADAGFILTRRIRLIGRQFEMGRSKGFVRLNPSPAARHAP